MENWPKFEQVTKKEPTPRRLEPLIFDEKSTSDFFAFFILVRIKRFSIYTHKDSKKNQKWIFHRKLKVSISTTIDSITAVCFTHRYSKSIPHIHVSGYLYTFESM